MLCTLYFLYPVNHACPAAITGSIISSTVLRPRAAGNETLDPPGDDVLQYCGAKDCPGNEQNNTNLAPIDPATVSARLL